MSTRMLIDARHSEETRVTVVKGSRVEEYDYESASKRPLKGNIYLARVTRVEPSLQAAFVEYGGNRHGFLAFSEIHPDYYQIPAQDRAALIEDEQAAHADDDETTPPPDKSLPSHPGDDTSDASAADEGDTAVDLAVNTANEGSADPDADSSPSDGDADPDDHAAPGDGEDTVDDAVEDSVEGNDGGLNEEEHDAEVAAAAARRRRLREIKRRYSIQEVIRKRQVLLVQVVKEERGNKGAALTTYLSLAGRYCVLMPNSTNTGGISRRISAVADRKRLKGVISSLNVPSEMGLIVRTAGLQRTKIEIKRDYDYLLRMWNGIRELTLKSVAPTLVYEEADLIRRTIRDLYTREVDEILVEGEPGYRAAKDFMKLLMPSHARKVQHYRDAIPLFHRYQVESQLESMYRPVVQLKSGGYLVINPTEALISIDVNSGRATREHNIEETAYRTNMEAAEEIGRQLRLRDMAGLVVIDFIDMEERRNNRDVERKIKDVLKHDRARIQVGRISSFGLLEMSRQRLRPNLMEVSTEPCPHCAGNGYIRRVEFMALSILRALEEEGIRARSTVVRLLTNPKVAMYLLNQKRSQLADLEAKYGFVAEITARSDLPQSDFELERETGTPKPSEAVASAAVAAATGVVDEADPDESVVSDSGEEVPEDGRKRRRRRRSRRRGRPDQTERGDQQTSADPSGGAGATDQARGDRPDETADGEAADTNDTSGDISDDTGEQQARSRRGRRGRRGGRGRRRSGQGQDDASTAADAETADDAEQAVSEAAADADAKPGRRRRRRKTADAEPNPPEAGSAGNDDGAEPEGSSAGTENSASADTQSPPEETPKPRRRRRTRKAADTATDTASEPPSDRPAAAPANGAAAHPAEEKHPELVGTQNDTGAPSVVDTGSAPASEGSNEAGSKTTPPAEKADSGPKRKGWWQRTFG